MDKQGALPMKLVIDDKIPYLKGVLEPFARVAYIPGAYITREILADADGLVIRTRTRCDRQLLEGTSIKIITTATIGFDHIDTDYCQKAGIAWANAPGCNAESVNQYMASALTHWAMGKNTPLAGKTIGVVGVGNVGSKVAATSEILGMKVLLNDPPRARKEGPDGFVEIEEILERSDIISLHVPLKREGIDKTFHMADKGFFERWKNPLLFINTCRGEVMDSSVLKNIKPLAHSPDLVIDCWEDEPGIDLSLMETTFLGTPHIAGYSRDGKANGTSQCIRALSRFFGLGIDQWYPESIEHPHFPVIMLNGAGMAEEQILGDAIQSTYSIEHDNKALKDYPVNFEKLRGDYPIRREFKAFSIIASNIPGETLDKLEKLGFKIIN